MNTTMSLMNPEMIEVLKLTSIIIIVALIIIGAVVINHNKKIEDLIKTIKTNDGNNDDKKTLPKKICKICGTENDLLCTFCTKCKNNL
jgi:hypothetical protein